MTFSFWTRLFDVLSPRWCVGCGQRLSPGEGHICSACLQHLPLTPFFRDFSDNPLARLFWGLIPIERAASLFYYEPQTLSAKLVHAVKYYGRSDLAEQLGQMFARRLEADGFFDGIDALIPVPLTKGRQRERGYNQSELIARGMSSVAKIPVCHQVIERVNFAGSQTHQNVYERRENVRQAFRLCRGDALRGKHLLLVDDVVTTGSTLLACATELTKIPDIRVSIATLGYAKN